jgi:hypothetical protein
MENEVLIVWIFVVRAEGEVEKIADCRSVR